MKLTLEQIAHWCSAELRSSQSARPATGYSIDSRTLATDDLFFAVKGDRFDGHDFVAAAIHRGAVGAVVSRARAAELLPLIDHASLLLVDDPLAALQQLAAAVRRHWGKRVVGVTGSAGKTTTKEAIAAVLGAGYRVLKSQGNLNNNFGLPLQLLRLDPEDEIAVIEMGMNHAGEITALARIAMPDWGVVTNVGKAHVENFADGIAGVARAKYELVQALPAEGVAFLNCDDPYVSQFGRDFHGRVILFGRGPCAHLRVEHLENLGTDGTRLTVSAEGRRATLHLHLLGEHNVSNALAALAVGLAAEIPLEIGARALESLRPDEKRGQIISWRGASIVNDCYNSNPEALKAMIATLTGMPGSRHILVAGEMLELGAEAPALHAACGEAAAAARVDIVVGVRGAASQIVDAARRAGADAVYVETPEDAGIWLKENLRDGDAVLLKASRGVRLERALDVLQAEDSGTLA
uniref:UDP-N-acetylmuramoyl-tripeptide--D-alanyl-D-alanine ligase n=1 Tax=Acidobacterium capsulatum TaxID=33075 RepID=A0A7V4XQC7_9BACT